LQYKIIKPIKIAPKHFEQQAEILFNNIQEYTEKRFALMAHWDPQKVIDPYVIHYATSLKRLGYSVILCSDGKVVKDNWPNEAIDAIVCRRNDGYDFSSWKAALTAFPGLFEAKEILLTNDSVFGPIGDLNPVYDSMSQVECDFWGLIECLIKRPHLQSFFMVLYQKVITNRAFHEFFDSIGSSGKRNDSIQYETSFTQWLISNDLIGATRFPASIYNHPIGSDHLYSSSFLQSGQFPFIKRKMIIDNPYAKRIYDLPDILKSQKYPTELITNYAKRLHLSFSLDLTDK
jgi:lipopolysaccharide biosynthesis protein